jgi:hypothetical protein
VSEAQRSSVTNPYPTPTPSKYSDEQIRRAIIRMSNHVAWMFWLWIGIPLLLIVLIGVLLTVGSSLGGQ